MMKQRDVKLTMNRCLQNRVLKNTGQALSIMQYIKKNHTK